MILFFVDCEGFGGCPATGALTEFGIVAYPSRRTFHGIIIPSEPDPENPAKPRPLVPFTPGALVPRAHDVAKDAESFINSTRGGDRAIMVSDNPAYDFMWVADLFWRTLGYNPFGHSARRLADYYAGLTGSWGNTQKWKHLRITPHDHNPVNDAMGNLEAFERIMRGER